MLMSKKKVYESLPPPTFHQVTKHHLLCFLLVLKVLGQGFPTFFSHQPANEQKQFCDPPNIFGLFFNEAQEKT
jgi:hypothetical protein